MFENQLILVVGLQYNRVFVKATDLSHQANAANQEDRYGNFVPSHRIEIDILNVLWGGRSFILHVRLHKIHLPRVVLADEPHLELICYRRAHRTKLCLSASETRSTDVWHTASCLAG